jgi:hypothetical protein
MHAQSRMHGASGVERRQLANQGGMERRAKPTSALLRSKKL